MRKSRIALITVNETRNRFRAIRNPLVQQEMESLRWVEEMGEIYKSDAIMDSDSLEKALTAGRAFNPDILIVHIPVWSEPILTVKIAYGFEGIPLVLLGNQRKETSSMVGLLGAGGALDQIGLTHLRLFNQHSKENRERLKAEILAGYAIKILKGQVYGQLGGRSLGMITATADPAQWMGKFGIDVAHIDQLALYKEAESIDSSEVASYVEWLTENTMGIQFDDHFDREALDRQVRSYLATKKLASDMNLDFIGVKCQPEMCDNYTPQCLAHMLCNSTMDMEGTKETIVHACEADSDGALTMQILKLLSGGKATALLDMRWQNPEDNLWTLANCGAFAADFGASEHDPSGLSSVEMIPHVIGEAGGCGCPMMASPGKVTMARLCRREGQYFMYILNGEIQHRDHEDLKLTTAAFPQAYLKMATDDEFLKHFGSNHLHMVKGNCVEALIAYCNLIRIEYQVWG